MFTGIVSSVGLVQSAVRRDELMTVHIQAPSVASELSVGDSVSVNGVCLTATEVTDEVFSVEVMSETLARTTCGRLTEGQGVNLELALRLSDRLGGHFVQGHVDGVGEVTALGGADDSTELSIRVGSDLLRYLVPKGSVAVDGVALTVVEVTDDAFKVALIPHTMVSTTLRERRTEDEVNVEVDVLGKYIERLLPAAAEETIRAGTEPAPS